MKRRFRLTNSTEFKRVRRFGTSFAHPLIVLVASPGESSQVRVGVSAGLSLGGAVQRNRARRRLRAAIAPFLEDILPGWEIILVARKPTLTCRFVELQDAIKILLTRAEIYLNGAKN